MSEINEVEKIGAEVGFHESRLLPIMRGNARMARGASDYFEVPIFSRLTRLLWSGCSPAEFPDELEDVGYVPVRKWKEPVQCHWLWYGEPPVPRFDAILNLYQWGEYVVPKGTEQLVAEMYDSGGIPDKYQVSELADWVVSRLHQGSRVLIHCQAGLNRSSMIAAVVLMMVKKWPAEQAIAHIRQRRSPMCLCNEAFERFVRDLA